MKKERYSSYCAYIIAIVLMINCRTVWLSIPNLSSKLNIVSYFLLFFVSLLLIGINFSTIKNIKKIIITSIILLLYFFIYLAFKPVEVDQNIKLLLVLLITLWLVQIKGISLPLILEDYSNIIVLVATVSIIMWVLVSILKIITPTSLVPFDWTSSNGFYTFIPTYRYIFFETQNTSVPLFGNVIRNTSIFTEAPMASLNFSLALLIKIFFKGKNIYSKVILIVAILSTFATTGYILLILIFLIKWLDSDKRYFAYKLIFLIPIGIVVIIGIKLLINQRLVYGTESSSLRLDDYRVGFITFLQNPILGTGLGNSESLIKNMDNWRVYLTGLSNSISIIFAQGGLYVGLVYIYAFIKGFFFSFKYKSIDAFMLVLGTLYLFVTTIFPFQYLLFVLLILFTNFDLYLQKDELSKEKVE